MICCKAKILTPTSSTLWANVFNDLTSSRMVGRVVRESVSVLVMADACVVIVMTVGCCCCSCCCCCCCCCCCQKRHRLPYLIGAAAVVVDWDQQVGKKDWYYSQGRHCHHLLMCIVIADEGNNPYQSHQRIMWGPLVVVLVVGRMGAVGSFQRPLLAF